VSKHGKRKRPKKRRRAKVHEAEAKAPKDGTAHFDVTFDNIPIGYSLNAAKAGDTVHVISAEFCSSEDGELFFSRLEGFPRAILSLIYRQHRTIIFEPDIVNMVAIIRRDRKATVHINAPAKFTGQARRPRPLRAGTPIDRDDIADVKEIVFEGIDFPTDAGVVIVFSVGWRKGLFYDLAPVCPGRVLRDYEIPGLLGGCYAYLLFRNRFTLSETDWLTLFESEWFPFAALPENTIEKIIEYGRTGQSLDDLLGRVESDVLEVVPRQMAIWESIESFKEHMTVFRTALERYEAKDYTSCIHLLYPRIEGVLRTVQKLLGHPRKASQKDLAGTVISQAVGPRHKELSPLLPQKLNEYLVQCYFAGFDPEADDHDLSRHTVSHGVVPADKLDLKGATISFLLLSQLAFCFGGLQGSHSESGSGQDNNL